MAATRTPRRRTSTAKRAQPARAARAANVEKPQRTDRAELVRAAAQGNDDLWWLVLMQGVAAIIFGVLAVFWPGLTIVSLVYLFSAFILAWGIVEIMRGLLSIRHSDSWWLGVLFGLIGLAVGIYLVRHPHVSFTALIVIIGLVLIGRGLLDLTGTFLTRAGGTHRALTAVAGAAALIAGIVMLFEPAAGGVAFVWLLGLYALIYGALTITLAIEAHRLARNYQLDSDRKR